VEELPVVLVVEDDQSLQSIVEESLTDGGFEPAIAPSGEEAVTLLKGGLTKYRALVTDINLSGTRAGGKSLSAPERLIRNSLSST
jgi:CheY-like chemotaxis protein